MIIRDKNMLRRFCDSCKDAELSEKPIGPSEVRIRVGENEYIEYDACPKCRQTFIDTWGTGRTVIIPPKTGGPRK